MLSKNTGVDAELVDELVRKCKLMVSNEIELLNLLPGKVFAEGNTCFDLIIQKFLYGQGTPVTFSYAWIIKYVDANEENHFSQRILYKVFDKKIANAAAKMLIQLANERKINLAEEILKNDGFSIENEFKNENSISA